LVSIPLVAVGLHALQCHLQAREPVEGGCVSGTGRAKPRRLKLAVMWIARQFTRNVYRGTPLAFAGDAEALRLSRALVDKGAVQVCVMPHQRE
jgi:uncharacterized protein (DUF924 family)